MTGLSVLGGQKVADQKAADQKVVPLRLFSTLTDADQPIIPLPADVNVDLYYHHFNELRCSVCKSPWRERAEHVYLESGKNTQAVCNFFLKHFAVRLSWESTDVHMKRHVDLQNIQIRGIEAVIRDMDEGNKVKYRERDFAIAGLTRQIDKLVAIDCNKRPEMELKRSQTVRQFYMDIASLAKERDEVGSDGINIFTVLKEIHKGLSCEVDKLFVLGKLQEIRETLASGV